MNSVLPIDARRAALRPEHVKHLQTSGLSEATIAAALIGSVGPEQAEHLGYAKKLAGIVFPYASTEIVVDGEALAYTRLRVDPERQRSPGRKYENPLKRRIQQGYTFYPYVPDPVAELRKDATRPVFVTEGEKKALKLGQEGFAAIGLPGVFMFTDPSSRKPPHAKPLHPDLLRWQWRGRTVYVCFDSDRTEKDGVALAHERLCSALIQQGAVVKVVALPRLEGMDKTGADDFLVAADAEAFAELVERAGSWEPFSWVVGEAWHALQTSAMGKRLFLLDEALVFAAKQPPRAGRPVAMQAVDPPLLTALLNRSAMWMSFWEGRLHHTRVPADVVRDMIAMPHRSVRVLDAVVHRPVLHRDATAAASEGYDPETRLFQAVDPAVAEAVEGVSAVPSATVRAAALELLN